MNYKPLHSHGFEKLEWKLRSNGKRETLKEMSNLLLSMHESLPGGCHFFLGIDIKVLDSMGIYSVIFICTFMYIFSTTISSLCTSH